MLNIAKLFGRSPFAPLKTHMDKVNDAVTPLSELFKSLQENDLDEVKRIADLISEQEHAADLIKNDIRNQLPKSLFLSIDRGALLEILSLQDSIADHAEDVAVLTTLKTPHFTADLKELFPPFLEKQLQIFHSVRSVMLELDELMEASFVGVEAEKVRKLVHQVALLEHEGDLVQRPLLQALLREDNGLHYTNFYLWQGILHSLSSLGNISEKLAHRMRMTLEI